MKVNVILSGSFNEDPEIRTVQIDAHGKSTNSILEEVFQNGQNMFAENPTTRSVSVGDMIELDKEFYLIGTIGFIKQGDESVKDAFLFSMMEQDNCNALVKEKFGYLLN